MNVIIIIILTVILVLTFLLITLLLALFQKHRKLVLNNFARDLDKEYKHISLEKVDKKELPFNNNEIKAEIYFSNKAVIGQYEKKQKIINDKNWSINETLLNSKIKIFYHYKIINLGSSKFVPLNKIDILLSKEDLYLFDSLDPKKITIKNIKNITVFWEKNKLMQQKEFFPGIAFTYKKDNYFLLFQRYQDVIAFLAYLNLLI